MARITKLTGQVVLPTTRRTRPRVRPQSGIAIADDSYGTVVILPFGDTHIARRLCPIDPSGIGTYPLVQVLKNARCLGALEQWMKHIRRSRILRWGQLTLKSR